MTAIVTALRAGLERETLQRMVDAASTALRLTDEQRRQADEPASSQPSGGQAAAQLARPSAAPEGGTARLTSAAEADEGDGGQARRLRDGDSAGEDSTAAQARPNGGLGRISLRIKMKQGGDASSSGVPSHLLPGRPTSTVSHYLSRTVDRVFRQDKMNII